MTAFVVGGVLVVVAFVAGCRLGYRMGVQDGSWPFLALERLRAFAESRGRRLPQPTHVGGHKLWSVCSVCGLRADYLDPRTGAAHVLDMCCLECGELTSKHGAPAGPHKARPCPNASPT